MMQSFSWCFRAAQDDNDRSSASNFSSLSPLKSKNLFMPMVSSTDSSDGSLSLSYCSESEDDNYSFGGDDENQLPSLHTAIDGNQTQQAKVTAVADADDKGTGVTVTVLHCPSSGTSIGRFCFSPSSPRSTVVDLEVIFEDEVLDDFDSSPMKQVCYELLPHLPVCTVDQTVPRRRTPPPSKPSTKDIMSSSITNEKANVAHVALHHSLSTPSSALPSNNEEDESCILYQSKPALRRRFKSYSEHERNEDDELCNLLHISTPARRRRFKSYSEHERNEDDELCSLLHVSTPARCRRFKSYSKHEHTPIVVASDAMLAVNEDVLLEHLLATNDIDTLWLEYTSRCNSDGDHSVRGGQVLLFIGTYEMRQGEYRAAFEHMAQASQCIDCDHSRVEAGFVEAEAQYGLGCLGLEMDDPLGAEKFLFSAVELHESNEQKHDRDPDSSVVVARCLYKLGVAQAKNGNFDTALDTFEQCVVISGGFVGNAVSGLWTVLDAIGEVYFLCDDFETSLAYHKRALKVKAAAVGEGDVSLVPNYKRLALMCKLTDECKLAVALYQHAQALLSK